MCLLLFPQENRYLEQLGVMGDFTTAMRDPTFYRLHGFIDDVFRRHKARLNPYNPATDLAFNGVSVESVRVQLTQRNAPANVLLTFWQRAEINLGAGLDFGREGNVFASFTHLQHAPFNYNITVNNAGGARQGTCRIFFCPKVDERGVALTFREQQPLMMEMDRFVVQRKERVFLAIFTVINGHFLSFSDPWPEHHHSPQRGLQLDHPLQQDLP